MQLNALIDLLEMLLPGLQILGDEAASTEINNRPDLLAYFHLASVALDSDSQQVASMHLADFRRMIMEEPLPGVLGYHDVEKYYKDEDEP